MEVSDELGMLKQVVKQVSKSHLLEFKIPVRNSSKAEALPPKTKFVKKFRLSEKKAKRKNFRKFSNEEKLEERQKEGRIVGG